MKTSALLLTALLSITMTACSSTQSKAEGAVSNGETAQVLALKTVPLKAEAVKPAGSIGVSLGTGGRSGVYGSVDLATLGRLYRNATAPETQQQIIVKRRNGDTIAITQPHLKKAFKIGESVKLLLVDGKARVVH